MAGILCTVLLLIGSYSLIALLNWAYKRHQKQKLFKKYGIPGPEPEFFAGNMHQLKSTQTPNDIITKWLNQYGDVFGYFIGETPYLVVKDISMLKQALIKDFHNFTNRPEMYLDIKPLIYTVLALTNQRWKDVRSVLTPTFSSNKIKLMTKIVNEKVTSTVNVVNMKSQRNEQFDVYEIVQGLTLDVIADCALAMKAHCQEDANDEFLLAVRKFFLNAHNKAVEYAIMLPFVASIMTFLANYLTAGKMTAMIVENVKEVIRVRRENPEIRGIDILQLMLDAAESDSSDPTSKKRNVLLTDDEIIANAYVFLLAGYETTATALAFTFYLLVQHQDIQEKLYEEIATNCPDGELSYDNVHSLQYLDQVFSESLRMYPPVTGFISRKSQKECTLGNYVIPQGVALLAPIWDIQHDPELWPDPWKFDPERFSSENKGNIAKLSYFPFGVGPRNCIGMRFAQLEAKLALARLVKQFKFVPSEKTEDPLTLICPTVIINPSKGVYLRAVSREQETK